MKKKLSIQDSSAKDFVIDLAEKLGTNYEANDCQFCVEIPEEFGSGYVKAYEFDHGFGVIETDYLLFKELEFKLKTGVVHPLKIIFNRESEIYHGFTKEEGLNSIKRLESIIAASTPKSNHIFKMPANMPICIFSLELNRKQFEEKIESFLPDMSDDLISLFRDVNGVNQFFHKGHYSIEISKFIEEFTECELENFMKKVYQEGKAYEIFTHQLKLYLDDLNSPEKRTIFRQATVERVEQAAAYIREHLETVMNVTDLAKHVGLNPNTLQNGFKQLYQVSVNGYIRDFRVESAKELMETQDLNITQITYQVGINSRSYFTKLFKKKYGMTPKKYLEQVKSNKKRTKSA